MTQKVENRKDFLINLLFVISIAGLIYCFFKYAFWVASPFLLSFFFAVLLQRPLRWLDKKTKKKFHTGWSILLVLLVILIILGPIGALLAKFASEISKFIAYLVEQLKDLPSFLAKLETDILNVLKFLPDSIYKTVQESISSKFTDLIGDFDLSKLGINMDTLTSGVSSGLTGAMTFVKSIPSTMLAVVIGIIAWIFFTKDYDHIVKFIKKQLPSNKKNLLVEIKQVFSKTVLKMVKAYSLIMFITFMELFLGFSILSLTGIMKNSFYVLIAIAIAIFDILPVAGSGGILIPWSIISLVIGNYKQGIGLIVIYVLISIIRQYIEPKIVGNSLGVNPIVTLMGLYFGLKLFGFIGMFIVPLCVMTVKAFNDTGRINLWKPVDKLK